MAPSATRTPTPDSEDDTPPASRGTSTQCLEEKASLRGAATSRSPAGWVPKFIDWKVALALAVALAVALVAIVLLCIAVVVLGYLLGTKSAPQNSSELCPEDWMYYEKYCYFYVENDTDWKSAKDFCSERNAWLATFKDPKEMDYIQKRAGKGSHWIGLHKSAKGYVWINGDSFDQRKFKIEGHGDCGYIKSKHGPSIHLSSCSPLMWSICKMEPYIGSRV